MSVQYIRLRSGNYEGRARNECVRYQKRLESQKREKKTEAPPYISESAYQTTKPPTAPAMNCAGSIAGRPLPRMELSIVALQTSSSIWLTSAPQLRFPNLNTNLSCVRARVWNRTPNSCRSTPRGPTSSQCSLSMSIFCRCRSAESTQSAAAGMSAVGVLRNMTSGCVDDVSTRCTYSHGSRVAQSSRSSTAASVISSAAMLGGVESDESGG